MTSLQSSELTELPVVENSQLFAQRVHSAWRWGHFALPKSPSYMAMGTLCTAKKPLLYGAGDTLHCQKAPHIWRWGHFALPKSPSYIAMGTLSHTTNDRDPAAQPPGPATAAARPRTPTRPLHHVTSDGDTSSSSSTNGTGSGWGAGAQTLCPKQMLNAAEALLRSEPHLRTPDVSPNPSRSRSQTLTQWATGPLFRSEWGSQARVMSFEGGSRFGGELSSGRIPLPGSRV